MSDENQKSHIKRLTDQLLADRNRETTTRGDIIDCFVCRRGMIYKPPAGDLNGRFCSSRCQDWYDTGNAALNDQKTVYRFRDGRPLSEIGKGFKIPCAHCRREFESLGLRCCSTDCERKYKERADNLAVMAEVGMEATPSKRTCIECGERIPNWRKGRKVSSKTRFCSPKCAARNLRKAKDTSEPVSSPKTII